ncbi:MAG TPA: T9SS type A sorting domain-containing protein [Edaphocola sp.]|nr:T9SS type A sorting domain-containing protein [Edaphocola sp.]
MKKILLSIVALMTAHFANAQFVLQHDTMSSVTQGTNPSEEPDDAAIFFKNHVIYTGNDSLDDVKWRIIQNDLPFGWFLYTFCDNVYCRTTNEVLIHLNNPSQIETMGTIYPNDSLGGLLEPAIVVPNNGDDGIGVLKVRVFDINQSDTAIFIVQKTGTSVKNIKVNDNNVTLFPNPGNTQLNAFINKDLDAKNVKIYNITGQEVANINVTAEIVNINTNALPSGNYIVLIEGQNGVPLVSKTWTKK